MFEMHDRAFCVIGLQRAARTALIEIPPPHEMMDDKLTVATEQVSERLLAFGRVEHIGLLDLDPGQRAPLRAHEIAHPRECLLVLEMSLACCVPLLAGDDLFRLHGCLLSSFGYALAAAPSFGKNLR